MKENKTENRISAVLFIVAMAGLLCMAAVSIKKPDRVRSVSEGRALAQYMPVHRKPFLDGTWTAAYETYSLDQFAFRDKTNRIYFRALDLAHVTERNGYVLGKEECILETPAVSWGNMTKSVLKGYVKKRSDAIDAIRDAAGDAKVITLQIPHKNAFFPELYPKYYMYGLSEVQRKRDAVIEGFQEEGLDILDVSALMEDHRGEYLYFYTDNHYTFLGAYYVYQELLAHLNETYGEHLSFPAWEDCDLYREETRFVGNYLRTFGDGGTMSKDYMEYVTPKDYPAYTRYENGVESDLPVLNMEELDWTRFMSGNCGNTRITTNRPELPNVLYIGYSYTNPLEYMSIYSFNEMHSLDLRYFEGDALQYIQENDIDYIVVLFTGDWEKVNELGQPVDDMIQDLGEELGMDQEAAEP